MGESPSALSAIPLLPLNSPLLIISFHKQMQKHLLSVLS